jgi:hypothetical protein
LEVFQGSEVFDTNISFVKEGSVKTAVKIGTFQELLEERELQIPQLFWVQSFNFGFKKALGHSLPP